MTTQEITTIDPQALAARRDNYLLLYVRTPAEFREAHIEGSLLHPLDELDPSRVKARLPQGGVCCVVCRSGNRARQAAEKLKAAGVDSVVVLDGGLQAWERAGLPALRGRKTISLERQVRIVAGAMVFTGTLLSLLVSPLWLILPGFVGAGLMFAGLTDWCGMGLLLARMPWNQAELPSNCKL
jgi:rhodanese-related sulfurtransferase